MNEDQDPLLEDIPEPFSIEDEAAPLEPVTAPPADDATERALLEEAARRLMHEAEIPDEVRQESPVVQDLYRQMGALQTRLALAEAEAESERLKSQSAEGFSRLAAQNPGSGPVLEELQRRIPQLGAAVAQIPLMGEIVGAYVRAKTFPAGQVPGQRPPVQVVSASEPGDGSTAQGRAYARQVASSGVMSEEEALAIWGQIGRPSP